MTARRPGWGKELHARAEFRAPLEFVFAWCTDFDPHDARREGDAYERRILLRQRRRVVFEDLAESKEGWIWVRQDVSLHPPDHWHAESVGNRRDASIDYRLTRISPERTRLDLRWRRRPTGIVRGGPSPRAIEKATEASWRVFARSLERDFRRERRARAR